MTKTELIEKLVELLIDDRYQCPARYEWAHRTADEALLEYIDSFRVTAIYGRIKKSYRGPY